MTSWRSRHFSQGSSSVDTVTHYRQEQGIRVSAQRKPRAPSAMTVPPPN
jgi:hypothetical protein